MAAKTKKRIANPMKVTPFRLPAELVERLDIYAERMRRETPGLSPSRGDALRTLLTGALDRAGVKRGKP